MSAKSLTLAIASDFGSIDVRNRLPKTYIHIKGQRLQPLCRKLGIKFAPALIGFGGQKRYGYRPIFDGVVISARSAPRLLAAIKDRDDRAKAPNALARNEKARQRKIDREKKRNRHCTQLGLDPDGLTAKWLERGEIDDDLAELIGWKASYRHKFTDYNKQFSPEEFSQLRASGLSPADAREA